MIFDSPAMGCVTNDRKPKSLRHVPNWNTCPDVVHVRNRVSGVGATGFGIAIDRDGLWPRPRRQTFANYARSAHTRRDGKVTFCKFSVAGVCLASPIYGRCAATRSTSPPLPADRADVALLHSLISPFGKTSIDLSYWNVPSARDLLRPHPA